MALGQAEGQLLVHAAADQAEAQGVLDVGQPGRRGTRLDALHQEGWPGLGGVLQFDQLAYGQAEVEVALAEELPDEGGARAPAHQNAVAATVAVTAGSAACSSVIEAVIFSPCLEPVFSNEVHT